MNRMVRRALSLVILAGAHVLSLQAQPVPMLARSAEGWHARKQQLSRTLQPGSAAAETYGLENVQRQFWEGVGWTVSSETRHGYQGLVRRESLEFDWTGSAWTPTYRSTYGEDGLLTGTYEWDASLPGYRPQFRYEYESMYHLFTGERIVSSSTMQAWDGSAWHNVERDLYTIGNDEDGGLIVIGGSTELWNGSAWVRDSDFALEEQGDDVLETRRTWWSDTAWQYESMTRYPSTTVGALYHRLVQLETVYRDMAEFTVGLLALPDMEISVWDAGSQIWIPESRRVTELYDYATGLPSGIAYQVWDGNDWAIEWRHALTYRFDGKPLEAKSTFPGEPGEEAGFVESFSYDNRGLPVDVVTNMTFAGQSLGYSRHLLTWADLSVGSESPTETPVAHVLHAAYPNPFNPSTVITYELGTADQVSLTVHDLLGRRVATLAEGRLPAGRYEARFDAEGLATGLYVVRLETAAAVQTQVVTLIR